LSRELESLHNRRQRLNEELVQVVKRMGDLGPRINEISRITSQYKESVRYRYHKFVLNKGIGIQATPNFPRLGFTRLVVFARMELRYENLASPIFAILSDVCYLRSFTRTLLTREYVIHVAVPRNLKADCETTFRRLREIGLFADLKILEFDETRNPPMMAEFYNFITEKWSFRWQESGIAEPRFPEVRREEAQRYDKFDLLILKELEIDSSRNLGQIGDRVDVSPKILQSHYINHIEGRNLVKSYRVIWPGTRFDSEHKKTGTRKDRYVEVNVLLEQGSGSENAELRTMLNKIPFLWFEAAKPNYLAELYVPNDDYVRFLEYLDRFGTKVGDKLSVFTMNQTDSLRFTLSYKLFDPATREWRIDKDAVIRMVESLMNNGGPTADLTISPIPESPRL
jgi:DNA-binding Lrp family transcriptional regulator